MLYLALLMAVAVAPQSNLNPGFEELAADAPQRWTMEGNVPGAVAGWRTDDREGAAWRISTRDPRSGEHAMTLRCAHTGNELGVRLYSDPLPVEVGDAIVLEAWVRSQGTPQQPLTIYMEGRDAEGWSPINPVIDRPQSERWLNSNWSPRHYTLFVPQGVREARMVIEGSIQSELRVSWFVDDCKFRIVSLPAYLRSQQDKEPLEPIYLASPDTLAQNVLGCYGGTDVRTPNIDRIAAEGRVFDQVTSACGWTKPSFASIMTSLYPSQHTVEDVHYALPEAVDTLAEVLKERGYFTAAFVWSAYDSFLGPYSQFDQGFDIYFCDDDEQAVSEALIRFLDTNADHLSKMKGGGLFLWHHYWEPHLPYTNRHPDLLSNPKGKLGPITVTDLVFWRIIASEPDYVNDADIQFMHDVYKWEANAVDGIFGRVLDRLQWANLLDRFNIVFCADHGESFDEKPGVWGHCHNYETCIRTPLIVRFPGGGLEPGRDNATLASNLDIMPTLLDLAGAPIPAAAAGRSLLRAEPNKTTARYGISESRRDGFLTVRDERHKLVMKGVSRPTREDGLDHAWDFEKSGIVLELYDLNTDPLELEDRAADLPDVVQRLRHVLMEHLDRVGALDGSTSVSPVTKEISDDTAELLGALGYLDESERPDIAPVHKEAVPGEVGGMGF